MDMPRVPERTAPWIAGRRAGGLTAAAWGRRGVVKGLECAVARSLSGLPNLAGFCREFGWIRDRASNSDSYTPLAPRVNHITKVSASCSRLNAVQADLAAIPVGSGTDDVRDGDQGVNEPRVEPSAQTGTCRSDGARICPRAENLIYRPHEAGSAKTATISRTQAQAGRSRTPAPESARAAFRACLEADSDAADAGRGSHTRSDGGGDRLGGSIRAPCWRAVPQLGRRGGAQGGEAAVAPAAARREASGRHRRHGMRAAARRARSLDRSPHRRGGAQTRHCRGHRTRDDSGVAEEPRAQAVAGKKCGACRSWTSSTWRGWTICSTRWPNHWTWPRRWSRSMNDPSC